MVRSRFYEIHNRLLNEGRYINPQIMKNHYFGMVEKPKMLCDVFRETNVKRRDGKGGLSKDAEKAFEHYMKAATNVNENTGYNGHARAMRYLGDCYANGNGIRKNAKQAALWYAKAEGANI